MDLKEIVARITAIDRELALVKRDVLEIVRTAAKQTQPLAPAPVQLELDFGPPQ